MPASKYRALGGKAKFKRCVDHVEEHNLIALGEGGSQVNAYAVCTAALKKAMAKAKRSSHRTKRKKRT